MSTKTTADKVANIHAVIDKASEFAPILLQAMAFTLTVERFLRDGDGSDPRVAPTESEVAEAMYALRAAIARATS